MPQYPFIYLFISKSTDRNGPTITSFIREKRINLLYTKDVAGGWPCPKKKKNNRQLNRD
jgi:hypothetical protein